MPLNKSSEDIIKMQIDAERRLKDRQRKNDNIVREANQKEEIKTESNNQNNNQNNKENPPKSPVDLQQQQQETKLGGIGDIFNSLTKDSDKTLILILILILSDEQVDTGLILALMYLII